jgi:hypothetical protein
LLYVAVFVAYSVIGVVLSMHYNIVEGDAQSRVANAGAVLFSNHTHLAAIGFVWNPLPSMAELPILLFAKLWPPLLTRAQAGTFMAAFFMAGAVWQVRGIALDRAVPTAWRWLVIAGFALNPFIVFYGGNGMSEAPFAFFALWATRRLLRWVRTDKVSDLAVAGIAIALAYTARYEAAVIALAVTILVVSVTALRRPARDWLARIRLGTLDGAAVVFPFIVSFAAWAAASWLITGVAFAQFSSQYGNASDVATHSSGIMGVETRAGGPFVLTLRDSLHLEPLLPLAIIALLIFSVRRIEIDCLVPLAVFGSVIAFEVYAQVGGQTFPLYRYFAMVIPLTVVSLILIWPYRGRDERAQLVSHEVPPPVEEWWGETVEAPSAGIESGLDQFSEYRAGRWLRTLAAWIRRRSASLDITSWTGKVLGAVFIFVVLAPSIPFAFAGQTDPLIYTESRPYYFHTLTDPTHYPLRPSILENNWYVANYLDQLDLPKASVLMDTFTGWDVWLASSNHQQFTITSDREFTAALNAPRSYGIKYILVSDPTQDGSTDAINQRYPTLYKDGAGIATLVLSVPSSGDDTSWRLYRVNP